ncbi:natterin-3-like [Anarrhichthys ocellatus]|uniref:natterin-3-like n=1 Tax=Anarrhichthys ocellatus TaxID=433405 RepID=UPI0012ED9261|nr:natterin-3-like [Anarrhichthys ocellatus]
MSDEAVSAAAAGLADFSQSSGHRSNTEQENVSFMKSDINGTPEITESRLLLPDRPLLTVAKLMQKRQVQSSSFVSADGSNLASSFLSGSGSNLEWVTWNNSLPDHAVSIYVDYFDRIDYVCKYKCEAGFYTPSMGSYCNYANAKKVDAGSPFEILEWKEGSQGSVPQSSVTTCSRGNIYVGKNQHGLGQVVTEEKHFYLSWKNSLFSYSSYQVLTTSEAIISQQVYNVRYITDESKFIQYPPEVMRKTSVSNYECRSVVKTDSLSKTYQVEHRWDNSDSIKAGVEMTLTAKIPFIVSNSIKLGIEVSFQYSWGKTVTEAITSTDSVEVTAPPNSYCVVNMEQHKITVNIPYTASLKRTYANGEIHTTSITGTYDSVQVGEVRAVADRCELLKDAKPCK